MLDEKIKEAEQVLRLAAQMSQTYYHKPLVLCYSGGKDSDVMLDIAKRCLKSDEFEVVNSHTTVDAPETVYHIRSVFKECETQGIKTEVLMPRYKGKPTSMWRLIEQKGMPPTRLVRYCCSVLKETSIPNRMIAVGVREDESNGRKGRDSFSYLGTKRKDTEWRSLQHTYAMFKLDQLGKEDAYECKFIQSCKAQKDTICNPIYRFKERDVWEYAREYNVKMNPLYARGYRRVGCVGCPFGGAKTQNREFNDYPKYKENYIKAFDRMQKRNLERGKHTDFKSGEDWFRWWLGEDFKQIRIEDLTEETDNG
ncbi:MAG: phosphoadenosine phosphosulfate reductase family protein [Clostridiales bacterium]|nr:phosphoadenosine phosphosulfate reductase family protein [Clostridiales bacterium]